MLGRELRGELGGDGGRGVGSGMRTSGTQRPCNGVMYSY